MRISSGFVLGLCALAVLVPGCSEHPTSPISSSDHEFTGVPARSASGHSQEAIDELAPPPEAQNPAPPGRTVYEWHRPCIPYQPGYWTPEEPRPARWLFDVWLVSREQVVAAGGEIVHEYHLPVIRARLPVSAVPTLVANRVRSAEDTPNEYILSDVIIGFVQPPTDQDLEFLQSLGVTGFYPGYLGAAWGMAQRVPDESIPDILANPRVRYVELNIGGCIQSSDRRASS